MSKEGAASRFFDRRDRKNSISNLKRKKSYRQGEPCIPNEKRILLNKQKELSSLHEIETYLLDVDF